MRIERISILTLALLAFWCMPALGQSTNELMDRFASAWSQDDAEIVASMLSDEIVLIDDGDVYEGSDSVNAWALEWMEATDQLTITSVRTDEFDDVAYDMGRWALSAGDEMTSGSHTFIFQRDEDDVWRIVAITIGSDPEE